MVKLPTREKNRVKKKTRQGQSHRTKYGTPISKKYYKKRRVGQGK